MKSLHLVLISSLLFAAVSVFAQTNHFRQMTEKEKTTFIEGMQTASKTTQTLQCNFVQKKESSLLEEATVSKGIMYFKTPDGLRWEYTSPQAFAFIMGKGQSGVKNSNNTTKLDAQSSKMIKSMTEMIIGMINGNALVENKNFAASYYINQTQTQIKLIPKNAKIKTMFSSISVYVNSKTYLASLIEMNETGGDVTSITLTNIKKNIPISEDKFKVN